MASPLAARSQASLRTAREITSNAIALSGVGPTSAKHVVDQYGGRVDISSREGEGTTVSVWLPLEPPPPGAPA